MDLWPIWESFSEALATCGVHFGGLEIETKMDEKNSMQEMQATRATQRNGWPVPMSSLDPGTQGTVRALEHSTFVPGHGGGFENGSVRLNIIRKGFRNVKSCATVIVSIIFSMSVLMQRSQNQKMRQQT